MQLVSIDDFRSDFTQWVCRAQGGLQVVLVDRDVPVACLEPISNAVVSDEDILNSLEKRGIIARSSKEATGFDLVLKTLPMPSLSRAGISAVAAVLEERESQDR